MPQTQQLLLIAGKFRKHARETQLESYAIQMLHAAQELEAFVQSISTGPEQGSETPEFPG